MSEVCCGDGDIPLVAKNGRRANPNPVTAGFDSESHIVQTLIQAPHPRLRILLNPVDVLKLPDEGFHIWFYTRKIRFVRFL